MKRLAETSFTFQSLNKLNDLIVMVVSFSRYSVLFRLLDCIERKISNMFGVTKLAEIKSGSKILGFFEGDNKETFEVANKGVIYSILSFAGKVVHFFVGCILNLVPERVLGMKMIRVMGVFIFGLIAANSIISSGELNLQGVIVRGIIMAISLFLIWRFK